MAQGCAPGLIPGARALDQRVERSAGATRSRIKSAMVACNNPNKESQAPSGASSTPFQSRAAARRAAGLRGRRHVVQPVGNPNVLQDRELVENFNGLKTKNGKPPGGLPIRGG